MTCFIWKRDGETSYTHKQHIHMQHFTLSNAWGEVVSNRANALMVNICFGIRGSVLFTYILNTYTYSTRFAYIALSDVHLTGLDICLGSACLFWRHLLAGIGDLCKFSNNTAFHALSFWFQNASVCLFVPSVANLTDLIYWFQSLYTNTGPSKTISQNIPSNGKVDGYWKRAKHRPYNRFNIIATHLKVHSSSMLVNGHFTCKQKYLIFFFIYKGFILISCYKYIVRSHIVTLIWTAIWHFI